jgi:hypothetical protein
MEWLDCSIPLQPPGSLDLKEFDATEDMFQIQVKDDSLVKIGSYALQPRFWIQSMQKQM